MEGRFKVMRSGFNIPGDSFRVISYDMENQIKNVRNWWMIPGGGSFIVNCYDTDSREAGTILGNLRDGPNRHGFGFLRARPSAVCFPLWFPILITGTLAAVLGIKRLHRFSLRFILVLTAMVAILMAIIVKR